LKGSINGRMILKWSLKTLVYVCKLDPSGLGQDSVLRSSEHGNELEASTGLTFCLRTILPVKPRVPAPSYPNKILALYEDGEFIDCFNDYYLLKK
jgi:hypothetical protein